MYTLFLVLLYINLSLFVAADDSSTCYPVLDCDIDPEGMKAAIELIPDPGAHPQNHYPDPEAYHVPALFEDSENAQILVRITSSSGIVLDGDGLMTHLWPHAKRQALELYDECNMETSLLSGISGRQLAALEWNSSPARKLEFQIDMTCEIDKTTSLGVTTYTASGIQSESRIGQGRNHTEPRGFGSGWV